MKYKKTAFLLLASFLSTSLLHAGTSTEETQIVKEETTDVEHIKEVGNVIVASYEDEGLNPENKDLTDEERKIANQYMKAVKTYMDAMLHDDTIPEEKKQQLFKDFNKDLADIKKEGRFIPNRHYNFARVFAETVISSFVDVPIALGTSLFWKSALPYIVPSVNNYQISMTIMDSLTRGQGFREPGIQKLLGEKLLSPYEKMQRDAQRDIVLEGTGSTRFKRKSDYGIIPAVLNAVAYTVADTVIPSVMDSLGLSSYYVLPAQILTSSIVGALAQRITQQKTTGVTEKVLSNAKWGITQLVISAYKVGYLVVNSG